MNNRNTTRLLLTHPGIGKQWPWEGDAYVQNVREQLQQVANYGVELVDDPHGADLIIFLEPNSWRDQTYARELLKNKLLQSHPEKCFTVNYSDYFLGLLPGVYTSLTTNFIDAKKFAAGSYWMGQPNEFASHFATKSKTRQPSKLFSFRGSLTHPVRSEIIRRQAEWAHFGTVKAIEPGKFYATTVEDKQAYCEEILDSRFVLCPRGLGCASHRLYEAMQLGRVPVIISEAWVEPAGPDWGEFSVRIKEGEVDTIPERLDSMSGVAGIMGDKASIAWKNYFSPGRRIVEGIKALACIRDARGKEIPDFEKEWGDWRFWSRYGLAPHQKLLKNIREGTILKKVARRLRKTQ